MRIDIYLHEKGFCTSRNKAKALIEQQRVNINGKIASKVSEEVKSDDVITVLPSEETEFVGRGGLKLEHAIKVFGIDVQGKVCADIGASTGGFTECLLNHGAKKVFAVDSGNGQLAQKLREDMRVISLEGVNARFITPETFGGERVNVCVMDVSFISQTLLYPAILGICQSNSDVVTLVKPQFEAGKANIGKHGIVKEEKVRKKVLEDTISFAKQCGFEFVDCTESPIKGGSGNIEYLLHLKTQNLY